MKSSILIHAMLHICVLEVQLNCSAYCNKIFNSFWRTLLDVNGPVVAWGELYQYGYVSLWTLYHLFQVENLEITSKELLWSFSEIIMFNQMIVFFHL